MFVCRSRAVHNNMVNGDPIHISVSTRRNSEINSSLVRLFIREIRGIYQWARLFLETVSVMISTVR